MDMRGQGKQFRGLSWKVWGKGGKGFDLGLRDILLAVDRLEGERVEARRPGRRPEQGSRWEKMGLDQGETMGRTARPGRRKVCGAKSNPPWHLETY